MKKALLALVVLSACSYVWYRFSLRAVDSGSEERVPLTIEQGMSTSAIASLLEDQNLIRSSFFFRVHARLHGKQNKLQAGKFVLSPSLSAPELIEALQSGKASEVSITIPEGFTLKDIDALLAENKLIEEGDAIACATTCDFASFEFLPSGDDQAMRGGILEGYLYPDTYYVNSNDFVVKFFLERLLTTFRQKVIEEHEDEIEGSDRSLHEIITMASLIEEETRTDDERPVVSGILWKRFDANTGLGVDATVRYVLDKPTAAITVTDLDVDSPYNTRKYRGLPPGPIASPSVESILAAIHPEESEYWYYLHGNDGQIRYATTNEEHNANRAQYLGN